MASQQSKKKNPGARNPDRRNGKAWKKDKNKPAPKKTRERQLRDAAVREERRARYEANLLRRQAEKEAAAELEALRKEAEARKQLEREILERNLKALGFKPGTIKTAA